MRNATPIRILVADDDADDRMLIGDAFEEACLKNLGFSMEYVVT